MALATKNREDKLVGLFPDRQVPTPVGAPQRTSTLIHAVDSSTDGLLERALALLEAVGEDDTTGVSELARRCNLPKSTTHRLLGILERSRLVQRVPAGYRLGHRLHDLADIVHDCQPRLLRETLLPYLVDVYEMARETVHLGVRHHAAVICVEALRGRKPASAAVRVGDRVPLHSTAVGKILLAHAPEPARRSYLDGALPASAHSTATSPAALSMELRRARRHGYAIDREEYLRGFTSVAVPVFGSDRTVVAAFSITGPVPRFEPLQAIDALRRIAAAASKELLRQSL